jgi:hypothetical protein
MRGAASNETLSSTIPSQVYKIERGEIHAFSSVCTVNTVCDFPCMSEAVKFQMWAVQLAFVPERQVIFQVLLLGAITAGEENGAGE